MTQIWVFAVMMIVLQNCSIFVKKPLIDDKKAIHSWQIDGRISIVPSQGEAMQGGLSWVQNKHNFSLSLSGPFGQGGVKITQTAQQPIMVKTAEAEYQTDAPERWMEENFGWSVPVDALRYWVLGEAKPDVGFQKKFDADGNLVQLIQADWVVDFKRYQQVQGVHLPVKIFMQHPQMKVRLVIGEWFLSP